MSTDFSSCTISSINVDVKFSGVLDNIAEPLEQLIVKAVDVLLCTKLSDL